jgi:uncharacterized ParB-like nuclease family protein
VNTKLLKLDQLTIDGGTQPRERICEATVAEYAEAIRDGAEFPAVVVYHDGTTYWLVDGFHRVHAHRRAGRKQVDAAVHQGTLRDAILYSLAANVTHGLRRSNADKHKAVKTMLTNELVANDDTGNPWSTSQIAQRCGVGRDLVARLRSSLAESASENRSRPRSYTTRHGTKAVMKTARIGGGRRPTAPRVANAPRSDGGRSPQLPRPALELPHDPRWAAKGLLSTFGADFVRDLVHQLTLLLKGTPE